MIRLTKPLLEGALDEIRGILEEGFLVQGRYVEEFEGLVAAFVQRTHAIAFNSGTSAIQAAVMALGLKDGDEVVVPDFTFPATVNAVVNAGATPVLADIDLSTFNLSLDSLESLIGERTKAVMPVDLFGLPADLSKIAEICDSKGLMLLEDAACALGASLDGSKCGSFGISSMISFHPRKIVTTGEGGMALTDDDGIANYLGRIRNHGIASGEGFVLPGFNFRMNEIEACLGIYQMKRIEALIERRRQLAHLYGELLKEVDEIVLPSEPKGMVHTYQSYVVLLRSEIDRDVLIAEMYREGVETAIGTYAVHVQPYYRERFGYKPGTFPNSYHAFKHAMALPMHPSLSDDDIKVVVEKLKQCIPRSAKR